MYWMRMDVSTSYEAAEAVADAMLQLSPSGVVQNDAEAGVVLTVYLPEGADPDKSRAPIERVLERISAQGLSTAPGRIAVERVSDEDWAENYRKFFTVMRIGRFLIKPSWQDVEVAPGELLIQLDPGLAFGTGAHPTTEGCLLFLQEYIRGGEVVLDLGTGSGILAIAAAKLGAARVVALDNDETAVEVARENAARNEVADGIEFRVADIDELDAPDAELVVANLTAALIRKVAPSLTRRLERMRVLIASGITREQQDDVLLALTEHGFTIEKVLDEDGWVSVVGLVG